LETPTVEPLPAPSGTPPASPQPGGGYQLPSDYYATTPGPEKKTGGCPRWLIFGCGGLGCLALLVIFAGGALMMRSGGGAFFGWMFAQLEEQSVRIMASDVTPEQKAELAAEFDRLEKNVRRKRMPMTEIQTVLKTLQTAQRDDSLTSEEVSELIETMREANDRAERGKKETLSVGLGTRCKVRRAMGEVQSAKCKVRRHTPLTPPLHFALCTLHSVP